MSLQAVFDKLGQTILPKVIDKVSNGECRVLRYDQPDSGDAQGFPTQAYTERTAYFIPCVWEIRSSSASDDDEESVASQVRGVLKYKITIPRRFSNAAVEINSADRIELKQSVGGSVSATLEVVGPINVSNVVWEANCIDVDAP